MDVQSLLNTVLIFIGIETILGGGIVLIYKKW